MAVPVVRVGAVHRRRPVAGWWVTAALAIAASGLAGCGPPAPAPAAVPLHAAPEPAVSPPAQVDLPGTVVPLSGAPEGVAVTGSGTVAVNVRQPDGLVIFPISTAGAAASRRFVPLGGSARHLTLGGPGGPALVPDETDDRLVTVALPGGQVIDSVTVGHQPHEAFAVGDGTYWVANEFGNSFDIVRGTRVVKTVPAPLQPGGGAVSADGRYVVGVGVRARRITEYRVDGDVVGGANCGAGPTHVAAGNDGLFWVNDTNGGAVLGFTLTAEGPRQVATIPTGAGSRPYGIAYDAARSTLWVTLTGDDQLLGLNLDGARVTRRVVLATVRQPNTVAVDPTTGEVVVTGSTRDGSLQLLPSP